MHTFVYILKLMFIFVHYQGVKKGDRVSIYLPMIPELLYTMLACARIGAVHSIVVSGTVKHFTGFTTVYILIAIYITYFRRHFHSKSIQAR